MSYFIYDVALSFAGEDRDYVKQVADQLRANGIRVFYDEYERANLWGKELIEYLEEVYKNQSKYVIIFVSKAYLSKDWTNHERKSALNRAFRDKEEYILPVLLDDTKLPGLHDSIGYLSAKNLAPLNISDIFLEKVGRKNIASIQTSLLLYRITSRRYAEDLSGESALRFGSRWNTIGTRLFFTATNVALATLEILVHSDPLYLQKMDFVVVQYIILSNVPIATVYESDLPSDWRQISNHPGTKAIGDRWVEKNEGCILSVPSAVVPHERNFLLNPKHERFKELTINKIEDFNLDKRLGPI